MITTHVAAVNAQPWHDGENARCATYLEFQMAEFRVAKFQVAELQAALPAPAA
jgi:hypothetical protein